MPLTILTDRDVRELIDTLSREDVWSCQMALADALHSYSTAPDPVASASCASNQPTRIKIKHKDGSNTMFMPSTSDTALGVKVLTISEAAAPAAATPPTDEMASVTVSGREGSVSSARSSAASSTRASGSTTSLPSTAAASTTTTNTTSSAASGPGYSHPKLAENIRAPLGLLESSTTSPRGCLTLLDPSGSPRALINAATLTAFRTALASTLILKNRANVHTVTVFGAGLQAYWHAYLTVLMRGEDVHHLHIINRDFERAQRLLMTLAQTENVAVADAFLSQKLRPTILTPEFVEYDRLLKEHVRNADVMYCCTPSTKPLFPAGHLTHTEGRRKARYIAAIGSYKPHMQELHADVMRQAVQGPAQQHEEHHSHLHIGHKQSHEGGAIIVDSIDGAMQEAGEVIKAGISGRGLVELGEIVMLKRSHWADKAAREAAEHDKKKENAGGGNSAHAPEGNGKHHGGHGLGHLFHRGHDKAKPEKEKDDGLQGWLSRGNVIYKSVGMGLMDVVVGKKLVEFAEQRGFGTRIDDF